MQGPRPLSQTIPPRPLSTISASDSMSDVSSVRSLESSVKSMGIQGRPSTPITPVVSPQRPLPVPTQRSGHSLSSNKTSLLEHFVQGFGLETDHCIRSYGLPHSAHNHCVHVFHTSASVAWPIQLAQELRLTPDVAEALAAAMLRDVEMMKKDSAV